jgi:hypothetical protein
MVLTVRVRSYFTIPLSAKLLNVASAFITVDTSLFMNVDLVMSIASWTASSTFEICTVRTRLLVVRPVSLFSRRFKLVHRRKSVHEISERNLSCSSCR